MSTDSPHILKERVLAHWDLLDRLARRRFVDQNLADEALLFVQEGLAADDWHRVRAYRGEVEFARFLSHVTYRLLEDFARHKFGRVRPPAWLKRLGGLWVKIFQHLCLERLGMGDVLEMLAGGSQPRRDPAQVKEAAATILARIPNCGQKSAQSVSVDDGYYNAEISKDPAMHNLDPEEHAARQQSAAALSAFKVVLDPLCEEDDLDNPALENLCSAMRQELQMGDEDRVFLRLVYQEGLNVSAAGRELGLSAHQAHGKLNGLLGKIRGVVESTGLTEDLHLLMKISPEC
mgnify:CR=1 FL=1